jgi:probable addiction module antidote protein
MEHMMNITTFDPAEWLTSPESVAIFMSEAFKTHDTGYIAHALGVVIRARGMTQVAEATGLSRENLYRSFSEKGNPTLKTIVAVMEALNLEITAKVVAAA